MKSLQSYILLIGLLVILGCAAGHSPSDPAGAFHPAGDYRHVITGLAFPTEIGEFKRTHVSRYDAASENVSGHYELEGPMWGVATVYHYPFSADGAFPTHADLSAAFDRAKLDLVLANDNAALLSESAHQVLVNGSSLVGFRAVYSLSQASDQVDPLASHLHLYALENWLLKFRFTHAGADEFAFDWHRVSFIESIQWPVPGGGRVRAHHPNCISIANNYELVARNKDLGMSEEQQLDLLGEPGESAEERFAHVIMVNSISVAEAYPDKTSLQIRSLVLEDCTVNDDGQVSLNRYWPWTK